jgi:acyl carrier protein
MFETNDLEKEVAALIIESLNLEDTEVNDIDPEAALFKDGLGLDSIDALELSMAISQKYGFKIKSDDKDNAEIFTSLRSLAKHIEGNRA